MRKTIYRLKKFRLTEVSLVDRPACDAARVERVELAKRAPTADAGSGLEQVKTEEKELMKSIEIGRDGGIEELAELAARAGETAWEAKAQPGEPEVERFVPISALPIEPQAAKRTAATSFAKAVRESTISGDLPELCDLLVQVAGNVVGSGGEPASNRSAILAALMEFQKSAETLLGAPGFERHLVASRHRERAMRIERMMRHSQRQQRLVDALEKAGFEWPDQAAAVRVIAKGGKTAGVVNLSEFSAGGVRLSAADRADLHEARDAFVNLCAGAGCSEDAVLAKTITAGTEFPRDSAVGKNTVGGALQTKPAAGAELEKLLGDLRQVATSLGAASDEVRKVAEVSVDSIRKAEGSAKVLSALAERVARLEAQPDNSRVQPLRTVEKGTVLGWAGAADENAARIAELQREAVELRKRADDPTTQRRLSEIGVEIIRRSSGIDPGSSAAVSAGH